MNRIFTVLFMSFVFFVAFCYGTNNMAIMYHLLDTVQNAIHTLFTTGFTFGL